MGKVIKNRGMLAICGAVLAALVFCGSVLPAAALEANTTWKRVDNFVGSEQEFWDNVINRISRATDKDTITVSVGSYKEMPKRVLEAFIEKNNVTMVLVSTSGNTATINSNGLSSLDNKQYYYPINKLEKLFSGAVNTSGSTVKATGKKPISGPAPIVGTKLLSGKSEAVAPVTGTKRAVSSTNSAPVTGTKKETAAKKAEPVAVSGTKKSVPTADLAPVTGTKKEITISAKAEPVAVSGTKKAVPTADSAPVTGTKKEITISAKAEQVAVSGTKKLVAEKSSVTVNGTKIATNSPISTVNQPGRRTDGGEKDPYYTGKSW